MNIKNSILLSGQPDFTDNTGDDLQPGEAPAGNRLYSMYQIRNPTRNAVIIEYTGDIVTGSSLGNCGLIRTVSIECKDEAMMQFLQAKASRLMNAG